MTTYAPKVLAEGQLGSVKATLYTVPALTQAFVKMIRGSNISGSQVTVYLYLNPGGTSRRIWPPIVLERDESFLIDDVPELEAADLIEGYSSTPSAVDFVITGVERA